MELPIEVLVTKEQIDTGRLGHKERKNLGAKLSSMAHFDFDVSDQQHAELLKIVHKNGRLSMPEGINCLGRNTTL